MALSSCVEPTTDGVWSQPLNSAIAHFSNRNAQLLVERQYVVFFYFEPWIIHKSLLSRKGITSLEIQRNILQSLLMCNFVIKQYDCIAIGCRGGGLREPQLPFLKL